MNYPSGLSSADMRHIEGRDLEEEGDAVCDCGHEKRRHLPIGYYDEVTEPEYRPSAPQCEACEVEREYPEDDAFIHPFTVMGIVLA